MLRFQCAECGLSDYEVGHLVAEDEVYCLVCREEEGSRIRIRRWEEVKAVQARLREGLVTA